MLRSPAVPRRVLSLLAMGALTAVAAGCGGGGGASGGGSAGSSSGGAGSSQGSSASGGGGATAVTIRDYKYMASTITVPRGAKVAWTNQDSAPHTATADEGNAFDTGALHQGQSNTVTFTKAGTFPYHCSFHAFMQGRVVVK